MLSSSYLSIGKLDHLITMGVFENINPDYCEYMITFPRVQCINPF